MRVRRRPAFVLAIAGLIGTAGCAARGPRPETNGGDLTVGVSTSGPDSAGLRFRLIVEPAGIDRAINADAGVFTTTSAPPGDHVVRLTDVPPRCRVEGGQERRVKIAPKQYPVVRFVVTCS